MKFPCPSCGGRIGATEEWFGKLVPCPHCGHQILVPGSAPKNPPGPAHAAAPGRTAAEPADAAALPPGAFPEAKPPRSRALRRRILMLFGALLAGCAAVLLLPFLRSPARETRPEVPPPGAAPDPAASGEPEAGAPAPPFLARWFSPPRAKPQVISCRLVDCAVDEAARRELNLADPANRLLVLVRLRVPARLATPSQAEYETMRNSSPQDASFPPIERCRWFDARKFALLIPNGARSEGLVLSRIGQPSLLTGLSGSAWGTRVGEVTYGFAGGTRDGRLEQLDVCFSVARDAVTFRPWRLSFAGFELAVPF